MTPSTIALGAVAGFCYLLAAVVLGLSIFALVMAVMA